jgi:hypothetical protein
MAHAGIARISAFGGMKNQHVAISSILRNLQSRGGVGATNGKKGPQGAKATYGKKGPQGPKAFEAD